MTERWTNASDELGCRGAGRLATSSEAAFDAAFCGSAAPPGCAACAVAVPNSAQAAARDRILRSTGPGSSSRRAEGAGPRVQDAGHCATRDVSWGRFLPFCVLALTV